MHRFMSRLSQSREGTTAIEYGLIAALISVAIVAAVTLVGKDLTNTFNFISNALSNATNATNG